jgi:hypothetical protein
MWVGCAVAIVGLVVTMLVLKHLFPMDDAGLGTE